MEDWICPIDDLDEDIREIVKVLYENGMRPYMSCSGSYKDHENKPYYPECGCIEMLDCDLTREFMAKIIKDKRFKCSIQKEKGKMLYDNDLPEGLRFKIEFENVSGDIGKELVGILQSIINGEKAKAEDRAKVDTVCSLINEFDVSKGNIISFCFNDEMVEKEKEDEENFSIEIRDRKNFNGIKESISQAIDDFSQSERSCKIYGSDFISMTSVLKKLRIDYDRIPRIRYGEKSPSISLTSKRINKYAEGIEEKREAAKTKLEKVSFNSEAVSIDDLMKLLNDDEDQK